MNEILLPSKVVLSTDVLFQELGRDSAMLDTAGEAYYGMGEVGTRFWQLLTEDPNPNKACTQLLEEYDVDETMLRTDLANLINELSESGLLTVEI